MATSFELQLLKLQPLLLIGNVTEQEANQFQDIYACLVTHILED